MPIQNYPTEVEVVSNQQDAFVAENEFFTSLKKTDEAFENLITFFKNYSEPTIVIMYGDHQPSLSETFYDTYLDSENPSAKYRTPFVIWSNFDLPEASGLTMSPNYLVPYLMEMLSGTNHSLPLSSYYQFLNETRQEVPVVTTWGYVQNGEFITEPENLPDLLEEYRMVEYNNVIDEKKLTEYFMP